MTGILPRSRGYFCRGTVYLFYSPMLISLPRRTKVFSIALRLFFEGKKKKKERVNYDISANFNEAVERFRYKTVETSEKSHLERTRYPLHPETTFVPLCVTQFNLRTRRLISPLIKERLAKSYRMVYRVIAKLPITSHCLIDVSKESRVSMDSDNRCQSSYKRREKKKKIRANDKLILSH